MVSNINNIEKSFFQPQINQRQPSPTVAQSSISSFEFEDEAIIRAEAKLLNELDKFNSGAENVVELAFAGIMAKITTSAEVTVINAKKNMLDELLTLGE